MDNLDLVTLKEGFKFKNSEIMQFIKSDYIPTLIKSEFQQRKEYFYNILNKHPNVKVIPIFSPEYPKKLKKSFDPPVLLYCIGKTKLLNSNCISVVGTRKPTSYGRKMCAEICNILKNNYTIVSGMAYGIDSVSHNNSKDTIAVLGSGVDFAYPLRNKALYDNITHNNLVVSEYFIGTHPTRYTFPTRNRIIAGLSDSTIVIEAAKKSGSLITANFALEYGRDVYALPGNINSAYSQGTNYLIYSGATPIISMEQIYETFQIDNFFKDLNLNNTQKTILQLIKNNINSFDELCQNLDISTSELLSEVMQLKIKKVIYENKGLYFISNY